MAERGADDSDGDDVLDDLGEQVLRQGGDVLVMPREDMPSPTGVAATFSLLTIRARPAARVYEYA